MDKDYNEDEEEKGSKVKREITTKLMMWRGGMDG